MAELDATLEDSRRLIARVDAQVEPLMARLDPTVEQLDKTLIDGFTIEEGNGIKTKVPFYISA